VVHYEHSSLIFNIVAPPKYSSRYNWRDQIELKVWTWGQDGRLINYDVNEGKVRLSYSTVTASVTCLDTLSLDPNRLAIGLRDGNIRVWDLSLPHTKIVKMQKYQQKFTHKVSAIAWHPIKEMVLGFGTEEGRVGFIEMISKKNTLFPHYFRNQVYKVEWGPIEGNKNNLGLYVLAEGKMAVYDITQPNEDPIQLELPEKLYVYKFAWKPDFTLLLINGKDGLLLILTTDLVALTTLYPTEKCLNKIVWHPDAFTNNVEISPRCKWFAATTSKGLLVYDCSSIEENKNFADNIVANFEGHLKPPLSLAWCPFEGNKIVSTAADGLALVWDVITKSLISTFVDPFIGHNQSILWSPHDPDLIIIGDRTIRIWRISKNPPRTDEEFLTARKRLLAKTAKSDLEKSNKNKTKADVPSKIKIVAKNSIVPPFYVSNDENISAQVAEMRKVLASGESLVENVDNSLDPLQLFGTKQQVSQLLDANYDQQKKEGKHKSCEMISLWKGNLEDHIQDAINENRVTPTLIVLAPMVSPKLWRNACEVYAKKLSEEANSDPLETAMYFLACHKVEEAVNCLCLNSMFREALALTKQRFPEDSDMITKVTEQWAEHCTNTGNFENAAFCYISLKQYEDAAKVLARRSHKEFLEFAAELAEKAQNKKLYNSIKFKCTEIETAEQNATTENEENVPSRVDAVLKNITENDEQSVSGSESEDKSEKEVKEIEVSLSLKVTDQITQDDEVPKSSDYGEEQEIQNIC
jgi:gem associated protein 5